ncbi:MAG: leucine-rich repeat domain-containing protein [Desulfobulbaceae bacterium]|nr:leucine-rich repeat domain-containing protein [Desulfobulbaceae bacterium]
MQRSSMTSVFPKPTPAKREDFIYIPNNHTLLRYFQKVQTQFMYATNFGLSLDDDDRDHTGKATFLRNLFVSPGLSSSYIAPEQMIRAELDGKALALDNLADGLEEQPRLFVLGDPGAGKSTMINWLMLTFSSSAESRYKISLGELVPFPMILREMDLKDVHGFDDLWASFVQAFSDLCEPFIDEGGEVVEQLRSTGQALFLLDGLDEITHEKTRQKLGRAILEGMHKYPSCRFVITSRMIGFNQRSLFGFELPAPLEIDGLPVEKFKPGRDDFQELPVRYLAPLSNDRQRNFINNWFGQYMPGSTLATERVAELIRRIGHNDGLGRLARIPVLLNMICFIHARRGSLPDGRAELYERISQTYLTGLDRARGLSFRGGELSFDYYDLSDWLGHLALEMQGKRTEENSSILLHKEYVAAYFREELEDKGYLREEAKKQAELVLAYLSERSGLFIPRGKEQGREMYAFSHLSFLEYFAARQLKMDAQFYEESDWAGLREKTGQIWWCETIVLFFEQLEHKKPVEKYFELLFLEPETNNLSEEQRISLAQPLRVVAEIVMDTAVRMKRSLRDKWINILWEYLLGLTFSNVVKIINHGETCSLLWTEQFDSINVFLRKAKTRNRVVLQGSRIVDIEPLQNLLNLKLLWLGDTNVSDVSCLSGLLNLEVLDLSDTNVSDVSSLSGLSNLKFLHLSGTNVSDVSSLSGLLNLRVLNLSRTKVSDISSLSGLPTLQSLSLWYTNVSDISCLSSLSSLNDLDLVYTNVSDPTPLKKLSKLRILNLRGTPIKNIDDLKRKGLKIVI